MKDTNPTDLTPHSKVAIMLLKFISTILDEIGHQVKYLHTLR